MRLGSETDERLPALLVKLGLIPEQRVASLLSDIFEWPLFNSEEYKELPLLEEVVSEQFLRDRKIIPVRIDSTSIVLAVSDPADSYAINTIAMSAEKPVETVIATPSEIGKALEGV